jgi:ABC-type branched-subunit amino acid transport system ATPase component/ABC-type branched-subunit amino acid transport system permease subunit
VQEVIRFALLGFGVGGLYALAAQGLIVIYRGSGVLNFALGAIGMAGVFAQWDLAAQHGWAFIPSAVVGVAFSALIGALTHVLIMRPLRRASPLVRVIATLGVLSTLQAIAVLRYGPTPKFVVSELPSTVLRIHGGIVISADRLILLGIAAMLTAGLWALYHFTRFGLATSAVAENERAASAIGLSPDRVAVANWALGSGLAGLAAILIAPIVTLQPTVMTNLILAAIAAALVAQFRSFPVALAAGLGLGIAQAELTRYAQQPGLGESVPFLVIVAVLAITGQALPLRDYFLQRLPSIGDGRISWSGLTLSVALVVVLLATLSATWTDALTVSLCVAFVLLSIVLVTGYAGQLSLAQYAIGGFGAWVAGRLADSQGTPFWLALIIGVAAAVPLGVLFAIPAVRARGINLAVVTLGLGTAVELILFRNPDYTGGIEGTQVGDAKLFGWNINSVSHPTRYGIFVLLLFVLCALVVANIRRGRSGRRLIAVRTNERAAAALGISVWSAKLYAFGISAAIAALGGILLAFRLSSIDYTQFTNFTSLTDTGLALLGGIGHLAGPAIGATLASGGLNEQILDALFSGVGKYIELIGGLSIIVIVLLNQNGIAPEQVALLRLARSTLAKRIRPLRGRPRPRTQLPETDVVRVRSRALEVRDLTVHYGRTRAVDTVSLDVRPGRITGLIGPNGAGKSSLIDAVTGFTRASAGTLRLAGQDISRWSAVRRARAGLGRSFQSMELFDDSTVLDNLRVASDPRDFGSYARDLVWPVSPALPAEVIAAIAEFGLEDDLDRLVQDLPYGKRRLLAIARAVATHPSVLLLDEPAAGLGEAEAEELADLVRRLADDWGMGILLVEHDMSFVMSVCDELIVLDFARRIAAGEPEAVRMDRAVIAAYLGEVETEEQGCVRPAAIVAAAEERR